MSEQLIRRVVLAAVRGEVGEGGWLKIDAPGVSDKDLSGAIKDADERGLVKGCEVTNMESTYPEWRLLEPTGKSRRYLEELPE